MNWELTGAGLTPPGRLVRLTLGFLRHCGLLPHRRTAVTDGCFLGATLFLGGWMSLHIGSWVAFNLAMDYIPSSIWFLGKTFFLIFLIMWFRWTFPRLRIDQLLNLEWKYLLPISMFNILLVTLMAIMGWHF